MKAPEQSLQLNERDRARITQAKTKIESLGQILDEIDLQEQRLLEFRERLLKIKTRLAEIESGDNPRLEAAEEYGLCNSERILLEKYISRLTSDAQANRLELVIADAHEAIHRVLRLTATERFCLVKDRATEAGMTGLNFDLTAVQQLKNSNAYIGSLERLPIGGMSRESLLDALGLVERVLLEDTEERGKISDERIRRWFGLVCPSASMLHNYRG